MELQNAVGDVFNQLAESLDRLAENHFTQTCSHLSDHTIGQHVRHIIEMFQCLENGYQTGQVDYEKRRRDKNIETDKVLAISLLHEIVKQIKKTNKTLELVFPCKKSPLHQEIIDTNYYREIAYNLEHTVHHMALIRVGLREISDILVDDSFGVASSTIKHRSQCVQ